MADIMHLVRFGSSPRQVWDAIATPEGIRRWWTGDADFDARVGGIGAFRFGGGDRVTRVEIELIEPPARMRWRTVASFRAEWVGTTIEFGVTPVGEETVLRFAHRGFPQADDDYAVCTTGWGIYLARLAKVVGSAL